MVPTTFCIIELTNDKLLLEGIFEEFKYEDKELKEAEGYFTDELADVEEFLTEEKDSKEETLEEKIKKVKDVFAKDMSDLGRMNMLEHKIDTGNAFPIKQTPYHAFPIVPKKSDKLCLYVDFQKVNAVMKSDAFLLPRLDELLEVFGGATWFTTLDLMSGFWQV
ncbi:1392_t:CDS:2 [Cetraspora pellucida]|uniref:1392_t:CDS:1 n=1 Tax=Cetraspora pellucida TaxID=1433469 RepID=A0ACA9LCP7_9GLOM|nr:1392_t:CDS:2 [Cetraspora pellucida]